MHRVLLFNLIATKKTIKRMLGAYKMEQNIKCPVNRWPKVALCLSEINFELIRLTH